MKSHPSTNLPVIRSGDDTLAAFNQIQDMLRDHALRIFHDQNPNEGDALTDWLAAESEVLADIDMKLEEGACQVTIDLSVQGFLPGEIELRIKDGILEVASIHTEESSTTENKVNRTSSNPMSFFRFFHLPDSLDTDNPQVLLECGKLIDKIPKELSFHL